MKKQLLAVTALAGLMVSSASMASMSTDYWLGDNAFGDYDTFEILATAPVSTMNWGSASLTPGAVTASLINQGGSIVVQASNLQNGAISAWYGAQGSFDMTAIDSLNVSVENSGLEATSFAFFIDRNGIVGDAEDVQGTVLSLLANGSGQLTFDLTAVGDLSDIDNWGIRVASDDSSIHARVPEPSVALLLGAGLMGLGFAARRKSKKSA